MSDSLTDDGASGSTAGQTTTTDTTGASPEAQSNATSGAASAESPPATKDDKQPKDMLSAVRAALDKGKEQTSGSGDEKGAEAVETAASAAGEKPAEGEGDEADLTEEEFNLLKPKTQRRIKHLLSQVEQFRPAAEQFEGIRDFCVKANLSKEDVNTGFEIMNLMRNKPEEALTALQPIYEALKAVVGEVLPKDLQEQVTQGKITEEAARELSRLRAARNLSTAREEQAEEDGKLDEQRQARETLKAEVGTAVSGWENTWKASDPDYRVKHARVMKEIKLALYEAAQAGTMPKNKQEAVALAERVKIEVDAELKKLMPRKSAVTPVTQVGAATGSKPVPKTSLEAMRQAIGR